MESTSVHVPQECFARSSQKITVVGWRGSWSSSLPSSLPVAEEIFGSGIYDLRSL